jgi:hypothetical protein
MIPRYAMKHRRSKHDFAFSGLITCAHCGCAMVGEIKKRTPGSNPWSSPHMLCGQHQRPNLFQDFPKIRLRGEAHGSISIQEGQPGSAVSELSFPQNGKAPTFRQVRLAGTGLWSQLPAILSFGPGFRAPVSARYFPISVSQVRRLVRLLTRQGGYVR